MRAPMAWGVVWGLITAAIPLGVWWLDPANVHALAITLIAAVYIGFAEQARARASNCPAPTTSLGGDFPLSRIACARDLTGT